MQARGALLVTSSGSDEAQIVEAIGALKRRGDQEAVALLQSLPADAPQAVRDGGERRDCDRTAPSFVEYRAEPLVRPSLSARCFCSPPSVPPSRFGVMGVINMAHGEMVMIGAHRHSSSVGIDPHLLPRAIRLLAPVRCSARVSWPRGAIGVLIERTIIRFLYGRPLDTLLATWGLSSSAAAARAHDLRPPLTGEVGAPSFMSGAFKVGELAITLEPAVDHRNLPVDFPPRLLLALKFTQPGAADAGRDARTAAWRAPWASAPAWSMP